MTVNERLSVLIKELGLTKTSFAKRINVSSQFISSVCSGSTSPSARTIVDICREYNVSERWLRTGEGEMFVTRSREELIAETVGRILTGDNEIKRRWISVLCRMPDEYWDMLDDLVTRYAAEAENDR